MSTVRRSHPEHPLEAAVELPPGHRLLAGDQERLPHRRVLDRREQHGAHQVVHVDGVAQAVAAVDQDLPAGLERAASPPRSTPRRRVRRRRSAAARRPAAPRERAISLGLQLAVRVGVAEAAARRGLVEVAVGGLAVDHQRAQVDDAPDAGGPGRLQHPPRALAVDPGAVLLAAGGAVGAVEDDIAALDRASRDRRALVTSPRSTVTGKRASRAAAATLRTRTRTCGAVLHDQALDQPAADEAGGAGDQHPAAGERRVQEAAASSRCPLPTSRDRPRELQRLAAGA